jgi:hypothetical protein
MTFEQLPGPAAYMAWFSAALVLVGGALLLWRQAVMTTARRLELRPGVRAAQVMLNAVAATAALTIPPAVSIWLGLIQPSAWVFCSGVVFLVFIVRTGRARLWWAWRQGQQLRASATQGPGRPG